MSMNPRRLTAERINEPDGLFAVPRWDLRPFPPEGIMHSVTSGAAYIFFGLPREAKQGEVFELEVRRIKKRRRRKP